MSSDPRLKRWYESYRKKYFSNALPLPSEMELVFDNVPPHGCCEEDEAGETNIIRIYRGWETWEDIARQTLLHEMLHIDLQYWHHGKKFNDGLCRLLQAGAYKGIL